MKIVISFSTIPSRINKIKAMTERINRQSLQPDHFILWLPEKCKKQDCKYEVPKWLESEVEIRTCSKDWGSATKLIPSLYEFDDPETIIITVDDDIGYEEHTIEQLVLHHKSGHALGMMGCKKNGQFIHAEHIKTLTRVDMLGGYRGILYKRKFFTERTLEEIEWISDNGVFIADDQFFAQQLAMNNIESHVIPTNYFRNGNNDYGLNFDFLNLGDGIFDGGNEEDIQNSFDLIKQAKSL